MATCYQVFPLIETIRGGGQVQHTKHLAIDSDAEADLDRIVDKFDTDASWLMHKLNISFEQSNFYPWVMIAFPEEYHLAGHVMSVRPNRRDVLFTSYSIKDGHSVYLDGPPPVSLLLIRSKEVLEMLAPKSPLFACAWDVLKSKAENQHWLYLADPLPKDWVAEASYHDDMLFRQMLSR